MSRVNRRIQMLLLSLSLLPGLGQPSAAQPLQPPPPATNLVEVPLQNQVVLRHDGRWKPSSVAYANALELIRTAREGEQEVNLGRLLITQEKRRSHAEAVQRLREIVAELEGEVTFFELGGWPALERRYRAPIARRGQDSAGPDVLTERLTTAVAAGELVVRSELTLAPKADLSVLAEAAQIARGLRFPRAGDAAATERVLRSLRAAPRPPVPQPPEPRAPEPPGTRPPALAPSPGAREGAAEFSQVGATTSLVQNTQGEIEVAVSNDGRNVVVASNGGFAWSNDFGATFNPVAGGTPGNFPRNGDPSLAFGASGAFYYGFIGFPNGTAAANNVTGCSTAIAVSGDNGQSFQFRNHALVCPQTGAGVCFPDQEHIAADRVNAGGNFGYDAGSWRVERHPRMMADVNDDGRDDIVGFGDAGVWVALSTSTATALRFAPPVQVVANYAYDAGGWRVERHPRLMADVNNDGRDDIVGFGNAGVWVSLSTSTATAASFAAPVQVVGNFGYDAGGWRVERHPRLMADVNDDGRDDIVGFGNAGVWVSLSTSTATAASFAAPVQVVGNFGYDAGGWRVERHPRLMADVNDDDRADIVGFGNAGTWVSLSTSTATTASFAAPVQVVGNFGYDAGGWRVERHPRMTADVNDDGRDDVVGFGTAGVWVSLSTSTATAASFATPVLVVDTFGYDAGGWRVERHPRMMADVNNDGRGDVVGFGNAGAWVAPSQASATTASFQNEALIGWDQVYSAWRNFTPAGPAVNCGGIGTGFVTPSIVCSATAAQGWSGPVVLGNGDFPRVATGPDGSVYVVYRSGSNLMLNRYGSCASGLVLEDGFPVTVTTNVNDVTCPVPGLDRCNNGNSLSSHMVAVNDRNASHVFIAYAANTAAGSNENVVVTESFDGGETWPRSTVVNTGATARRFMPWICSTNGQAFVSWYDRRAATAANNDLTDFFVASLGGSEINLSVNPDPQCASGWPCAPRGVQDAEGCSVQPQLAGRCSGTGAACDFSAGCPLGQVCNGGGGCPKYGDYNGNACAAGRVYTAWASATAPPGVPAGGGIRVFASTLLVEELTPVQVVANFGYDAGGWRVERHPRMMADVNNDGRDDLVGFGTAGVWVSLSTSTATTASFAAPVQVVANFGYDAGGWRVERHPRLMADVNNDGRDDIVGFGTDGVWVSLSASTATTASFASPVRVVGNFGYDAGGWRIDRHPRMMADVNNDGRDDIVGFGTAGVWVSLSTSTATTASFAGPVQVVGNFGYDAGGWRVERHPRMMADVNNDGRDDIVGFGTDGVWVSLSTSTATVASFASPLQVVSNFAYDAGGWRVERHPRMMADVNSDGRNDIVGFGNAGVWVSLSTSTATVPSFAGPVQVVANFAYDAGGWRVERHPRMTADVSNDDRADIVGFGNAGVWISPSTSTAGAPSFTGPVQVVSNFGYDAGGWRVERHPRMTADVNNDGRADIVGFGNAGVWVLLR